MAGICSTIAGLLPFYIFLFLGIAGINPAEQLDISERGVVAAPVIKLGGVRRGM